MQVLIIDSSIAIIERLAELLSESNKDIVIFKAVTYQEAITKFLDYHPEVILLDTSLERNLSIKLLKEMKVENEKCIVIALSIHSEKNIREQWNLNGVDHYLDKYSEFEKIAGIIDVYK